MGPVRRVAWTLALCTAAALGVGVPIAAATDSAQGVEVVASGLDNPRGLDLAHGVLYVAESGRGGTGPCITNPEGMASCLGATGALTAVHLHGGGQHRILSGLPSHAVPGGGDATGPSDVSLGRKGLYFTIGLGAPPAARDTLGPAGAMLGTLKVLGRDGSLRLVADLAAFEGANNPDAASGGEPDSNPNSVDAKGRGQIVADAGGNDVLKVKRGAISVVGLLPFLSAPFPPGMPEGPPPGTMVPVQPVPTSVVRAPDGSVYVGQLTGFPFAAGLASVYRIPKGGSPEVVAGGFTTISDIALGADGSLYVLQIGTGPFFAQPGALIRVHPDGTREELAAGRLTFPTGLAVGEHAAYVSNRGNEAGTGEVLRIPLGH